MAHFSLAFLYFTCIIIIGSRAQLDPTSLVKTVVAEWASSTQENFSPIFAGKRFIQINLFYKRLNEHAICHGCSDNAVPRPHMGANGQTTTPPLRKMVS